MKVILLAGGFGTRLSGYTKTIPKPMVEISGKPLLLHQIELCRKFGFTNIYILIHHKGDVIKKYFGDGEKFEVKITYQEEKFPRGTAGAVIDLYEELAKRPVDKKSMNAFLSDSFTLLEVLKEFIHTDKIMVMALNEDTQVPFHRKDQGM